MITWDDAHRRAAVLAAEQHSDLEVDLTRPVDVFSAIERLGLILGFAPLGKVSGVYIRGAKSPGILIHSGHPRTRQRYTAAHELGHHVFGHHLEVDADLELDLQREAGRGWSDQEKEAEAFGAWFLMPRRLLKAGLEELGLSRVVSPFEVYLLSLWLGTSFTATVRQLATTRLVSRTQSESWSRISPKSIKQAIAGKMMPDDLRNDVWWLDPRHDEDLIEARPGDRLVFTLPEIPSSGFSWNLEEAPEGFSLVADSDEDDWQPEFRVSGEGLEFAPHSAAGDLGESAGAQGTRSLVLAIAQGVSDSLNRIRFVKRRPWSPEETSAELTVIVAVHPPLRGLQLASEELTIIPE